jgi:hypothetical protein
MIKSPNLKARRRTNGSSFLADDRLNQGGNEPCRCVQNVANKVREE